MGTFFMKNTESKEIIQGTLFEENYLARTHKTLTSNPVIAITELVANAWDAGASKVIVTIPEEYNQEISIEDNGCGLSDNEFKERWMTLSYNRLVHQGSNVSFPPHVASQHRIAFGRNGIGRHGMLCFAPEYTVITSQGNNQRCYKITTKNKSQALLIQNEELKILSLPHYGTKIIALVEQNKPNPEKILEELSKRFITDPSFEIQVNGKSLDLSDLVKDAPCGELVIKLENKDIKVKILQIDTQKPHKNTLYQGIAFWQGKRLIGEPSWILGKEAVLDGRTQQAKRYTFIVQSEDFADFISEDWTGFIKSPAVDTIYNKVAEYIKEQLISLNKQNIDNIKASVKKEYQKAYSELSALGRFEVNEAISHIVQTKPMVSEETLSVAVDAIINLEQAKNGAALLQKLSTMEVQEIDSLYKLLSDWSIRDALAVLNEIERRVKVIEAIDKLHSDKNVDELHVLHPLLTEARWVFGPEFESREYTSNKQLRTVAKKIFNVTDANFQNETKRPDIIVKGDFTYGLTGIEGFESECGISQLQRILLIELKRGGFVIGKQERFQAQTYAEELFDSSALSSDAKVIAFVVGDSLDRVSDIKSKEDRCITHVITFSQLIDTANKRLFKLQSILCERYQDVSGVDLAQQVQQSLFDDNYVQ